MLSSIISTVGVAVGKLVAKELVESLIVGGIKEKIDNVKLRMELAEGDPAAVSEYFGKVMKKYKISENAAKIAAGYFHMNKVMGEEQFLAMRENSEPGMYPDIIYVDRKDGENVPINLSDAYKEFAKGLPKNFDPDNIVRANDWLPGSMEQNSVYVQYLSEKVREVKEKDNSAEISMKI